MKKQGFTLIELLVVIAIIGLLAGLMVPVAAKGTTGAKKKKAELEANALVVAAGQFHSDHHYMPTTDSKKLDRDDHWVQTSDKKWLEVLQGDNPMKKNYLGVKVNDSGEMLDPWGNGYWVGMDRNLDGRVDPKGDGKTAMETVVAISCGPDGTFGTDDDISTSEH